MAKTLHNSDASRVKQNVPDVKIFGDGDMWQLLCKASSESEGWMKSTKAMEIPGMGCVIQVTTQQGENVSESTTFVPKVRIVPDLKNGGRKLVRMGWIQRLRAMVGLAGGGGGGQ